MDAGQGESSRVAGQGKLLERIPAPWVTLSLLVAFVLVAATGLPPPIAVAQLFVLGGLLFASLRWRIGWVAALALFLAGITLRVDYAALGSDVLIVTRAAIEQMLAGGNPYGVGYEQSIPPGAPFPYGPLALVWYLPPIPGPVIELLVATLILVALALRGSLLGLAIYASAPVLVSTAADGSNDTTLGLLLLAGLGALSRWPLLGAFGVGLAVAFKPTALAWALPLIGWAGLPGALALGLGAAIFWLPAALMWGPAAIVESIRHAATLHQAPYYSLAYALLRFDIRVPDWLMLASSLGAGALLALVAFFRVRSPDAVIGWGALVFLVTLFGGFWSTYAYFAALGPIVCWSIDRWLGHAGERARWPSDPYGRLLGWLDKRWPALESGAQRRI